MHEPYAVTKMVKRGEVFFRVPWTPLREADRHEVAMRVPSLAGLFQLYWEDGKKKLHLFSLEPAWYGGLRAKIAEKLDSDFETDPGRKAVLADRKLFYRYVLVDTWDDVKDLMCLYLQIHQPQLGILPSSGRYTRIHIQENPLAG